MMNPQPLSIKSMGKVNKNKKKIQKIQLNTLFNKQIIKVLTFL